MTHSPSLTVVRVPVPAVTVTVTRDQGAYDIHAEVNGTRKLLAFATKAAQGGYSLVILNTQFGALSDAADSLTVLTGGEVNHAPITLAEVRNRAHVLGGLYLAAQQAAA